ncbi:MAG TPA: hypothetical protein VER56_00430 [Candidatus Eisenbacteria bacterium]|nr:hypothetical protein [Candidatus Eisenbacteria bacterium]
MPEDEDIRQVMEEEKRRGVRRNRLDTEERRKAEKTKLDLARVLASGDERGFMKIMREIGLKDDSPEFLKALKAFREQAGRR